MARSNSLVGLGTAALITLALACFAPPALAGSDDQPVDWATHVSGAGNDPVIRGAIGAADAYWARMGFALPCPAVAYLYDDGVDTDTNARGEENGCQIWVTRRVRATVTWRSIKAAKHDKGFHSARYWSRYYHAIRRVYLRSLCTSVTHERGHNLGLGHDDWHLVMHHDRPPSYSTPECFAWAASVAPDPS